MSRKAWSWGMAAALIGGVAGWGCSSKPVAKSASSAPAPTAPSATAAPSETPAATASDDRVATDDLPRSVDEINRKGYLHDAFFDLDRAEIRADQRPTLDADAQWLRRWPSVRILVEGHCDERGTEQYNMALGEKRADAVKDYLESLGVPASRIAILSLGKERPIVPGHDETAWAQNRRDHFVVTAR